jgi:hypothetical protein
VYSNGTSGAAWPFWNKWFFFGLLALNVFLVEVGTVKVKVAPVICNAGAEGRRCMGLLISIGPRRFTPVGKLMQ